MSLKNGLQKKNKCIRKLNADPQQFATTKNSDSSVQIQIRFWCEFVPWNTRESGFLSCWISRGSHFQRKLSRTYLDKACRCFIFQKVHMYTHTKNIYMCTYGTRVHLTRHPGHLHIWMSHVTRTNESCHRKEDVDYLQRWWLKTTHVCNVPFFSFPNGGKWQHVCFMSHTYEKSCHTSEWVMSHIRMSHVTRHNESCHTYEWVMSHIQMSHGPEEDLHHFLLQIAVHDGMNQSGHVHSRVMSHMNGSHIWMSHVTLKSKSCHTYEWVMSNIRMSHGPEEDLHHFLLQIAVHDRMNQSGHVH